jgi:hypothetical protein
LKEDGVLILDDSNRTYYHEIFNFYRKKGFKEITFSGLKPSDIEVYKSEKNCLGI